jgi:hypothetical protein
MAQRFWSGACDLGRPFACSSQRQSRIMGTHVRGAVRVTMGAWKLKRPRSDPVSLASVARSARARRLLLRSPVSQACVPF